MHRRQFIKLFVSGCVLFHTAPVAAITSSPKPKKIVWVMLRGAMDALHAVTPVFDTHLLKHRKILVIALENERLPLENGFALHPSLKNMHQWYQRGQMLPIVAVASPYRSRSHFDAQDLLESGLNQTDHDSGWLSRAVSQYSGDGIAIARSLPISLRGPGKTATWFPSALPKADKDLYQLLSDLYQSDPQLSKSLEKGLQTRESMDMTKSKRPRPKFTQLSKNCGDLLARNDSLCCAMLEMGGWDTHNNQAARLNQQFKQLDQGLGILENTLGDKWKDTIVIIATEFGRTVAVNGTKGTDHGTASVLLLAGGAVRGGRIKGKWPGLEPHQLYEGRDLMPTSDIRSWIAAILTQHWELSTQQLSKVFPSVKPVPQQLIN